MGQPDDTGLEQLRGPLNRAKELAGWYEEQQSHRSTGQVVWDALTDSLENSMWANPLGLEVLEISAFLDPRKRRVFRAIQLSLDEAMSMMGAESLQIGRQLLSGLLPMLGQLAELVCIGAGIGGAVGMLGGPFDEVTVPGGAAAGAEIALTIGGYLGMATIIIEAAPHLGRFLTLATEASWLAYHAGQDRPAATEQDVHAAARIFAAAIAELWWLILQALIAYVMKRAGEIGGKAAGKAIKSEALQQALIEAKGKTAKFGSAFGEWFEKNFPRIKEVIETRDREMKKLQEGDAGGDSEASKSEPPKSPRNPAKLAPGFEQRARPAEVRTAQRLTQDPQFDGRTFDAPPPPDPGYDWTDDQGKTYDAMGDGTKSQYFKLDQFTNSIDSHLLKGNDFTVIDMTGYTPDQIAAVTQYVNGLPPASQAQIIRVGF